MDLAWQIGVAPVWSPLPQRAKHMRLLPTTRPPQQLSSGSRGVQGPPRPLVAAAGGAATATATATAAARTALLSDLGAVYLPLLPHTRTAADCSLPLWALAKAGSGSSSRSSDGGSGDGNSSGDEAAAAAEPQQQQQRLAAALLQRLVDPEVLATARPNELSNALWALARLREGRPGGGGWDAALLQPHHLNALAAAVAGQLQQQQAAAAPPGRPAGHRAHTGQGFPAQAVSNILWACAKLEYRDPALLQPLAAAAAATAVPGTTGQALSNSLWALAVLGCTGPEYGRQ